MMTTREQLLAQARQIAEAGATEERRSSLEDLEGGLTNRLHRMPGDDLRYMIGGVSKALYDVARRHHNGVRRRERELNDGLQGLYALQRELHGRLYNPAAEAIDDTPEDLVQEVADHIHTALNKLPEFSHLQDVCRNNAPLSTVSACELVDGVVSELLQQWQEAAETKEGKPAERMQEAIEEWCDAQEEDAEAQGAARCVMAAAITEAVEAAEETSSAIGLIAGRDEGAAGAQVNAEAALRLAGILAQSDKLRAILRLLGRFRRAFADAGKTYQEGQQSPYSVKPDNDLKNLLPVERLNLANPATSFRTLHRLQQKQTLCYAVRSRQPSKLGPFAVALDCSGSMQYPALDGMTRLEVAGAFSIAALMQAADEGRQVRLFTFAARMSAAEHRIDLTTPEGRADAITLITKLVASGGTQLDPVFDMAADLSDKSDLLVITDGAVEFSEGRLIDFTRKTDVHLINVYGGTTANAKLRKHCKQVVDAHHLNEGEDISNMIAGAASRKVKP